MEDGLEAEKKTEIGGKEIWKLKQKPEERWWRPELGEWRRGQIWEILRRQSCEDGLEEDESRRKPGTYTFSKWYDQRGWGQSPGSEMFH